jgi:hypothetical protein
MATARLLDPPARLAHQDPAGARAASGRHRLEPATVLALALLAACLYAAFAHGSVAPAPTERLQLALAVVAAASAAAWLWNAKLVLRAPAQAWAGLALLIGFAIWSGLSILWSVSPDSTWAEANRALGYVLVVGLAVAFGASHPRAIQFTVRGFLAVVLAVTAYALGQKLVPGLHVTGLFNLDQTGQLPRLQEPFGYWNALGLFIALGVPLALSLAVDRERSDRLRMAAASVIVPMLVTIAFTYSRGAALALIGGLAVGIALSGARLRSLLWLGLATMSAAPPVILGLLNHSLTAINVDLGDRELAGVELAAVIAACMTLLALAAPQVIQHEGATDVSSAQARLIKRSFSSLAAVLVAILLIVVALSPRGLPGTVSHGWRSFTSTRAVAVNDPGRLLSADSENRWVWWKEAARAFGDRPIAGWGAGSFGVVHLLYRRDQLSVQQPHSVPLQFLAETGVIGAVLGLGAVALLLAAAARSVRHRPRTGDRLLAAGLLAGAVTYAVHALYDWDWEIPGVTLPALLFLGVLAGGALVGRVSGPATAEQETSRSPRVRWQAGAAVASSAVCLSAFALSVMTPRLAAARAGNALLAASSASGSGLRPALSDALLADRLDPVSDRGLLVAATVEIHLHHNERARRYLLAAVERQPTDGVAWQRLAVQDLVLGDRQDGVIAGRRALARDPHGVAARALAANLAAAGRLP